MSANNSGDDAPTPETDDPQREPQPEANGFRMGWLRRYFAGYQNTDGGAQASGPAFGDED